MTTTTLDLAAIAAEPFPDAGYLAEIVADLVSEVLA